MGKGQGKLCVIFNKGRKGSRDIERERESEGYLETWGEREIEGQ